MNEEKKETNGIKGCVQVGLAHRRRRRETLDSVYIHVVCAGKERERETAK